MTALSNPGIGPHDVLCGRGGATNNHPGNQRFRAIVAEHMPEYLQARKKEKAWIARRVVRSIQQDSGRFLKRNRNPETGQEVWMEVTDKKATEKTSQALREGLDVRHKTYRPEKLSASTLLNARIPRHHNSSSHQQQQLRGGFLPVSPSSPYSENPRTRTRLVEGTVLSPHRPGMGMAMTTVSTIGAQRLLHRIPRDPSQDDLASSCGSSIPDLAPEFPLPAAFRPPQHRSDPLRALFEPPRITKADCEDVAAV